MENSRPAPDGYFNKEELMRNIDSVAWGFSGGCPASPELTETQRICEKIWTFLNSKVCNIVIVIFVFAEGVVVLSELLIDLDVIQDPEWKSKTSNCSQSSSVLSGESPRLKKAKEIFSYCSITFLTIFIIEIILRIVTGKTKFIVQGIEVFDAIVVLIAFGLDITFFIAPSNHAVGKESAVLIILLRLWRIKEIICSIIDSSKAKLSSIISNYQKEKAQSEQKVDLLILKVEDLEHEVAYLKEKLKKTEKEPLFLKRQRGKNWSGNPPKHSTISIAIEPNSVHLSSSDSQVFESQVPYLCQKGFKDKISIYAEKAAAIIVDEALLLASHLWFPENSALPRDSSFSKTKCNSKLRRRPEGSIESGYGSAASSINWNKVRANPRTEERCQESSSTTHGNRKCPESSPESGYGSGGSAHHPHASSASPKDNETESVDTSCGGSTKHARTVFLFPDSSGSFIDTGIREVELDVLDEVSEIERIKQVEFDPYRHEKDVPMTSL